MSRLYWLLNLVLASLAVLAILWVANQQPQARRELPRRLSEEAAVGSLQSGAGTEGVELAVRPLMENLDDLYKRSLFRPDRSEVLEEVEDTDDQDDSAPQDMELIGIGIIGKEAAAIILVKEAPQRRIRGRVVSSAVPEKKPTRHVYRIGQSVADSGYIIKEIELKRVVLERGDEERVLELQHGDQGSQQRVATAEAEAKKAAAVPTTPSVTPSEKSPTLTPPPPPPPPPGGLGTPSAPSATATTPETLSREERIRRALEARRRILERRKAAQETQ